MSNAAGRIVKQFKLTGRILIALTAFVALAIALDLIVGLGWGFTLGDLGMALAGLLFGVIIHSLGLWFGRVVMGRGVYPGQCLLWVESKH